MYELYLIKKYWKLMVLSMGIFLFFLLLLCSTSTGSSQSVVGATFLKPPFEEHINFVITSNFGERDDPFEAKKSFHTGVDLAAPDGTNIVASADGEVVKVGYDENGLGNYVYIKHNNKNLIFYTIYGHLLDNSIIVRESQFVKEKEVLGVIGSTGRSTGTHLHFMVTMYKLSFEKKYLVDPIMIIKGL